MRFSAEEIAEAADALGFRRDSLEKVARLVSLLERLRTSSFLRSRVALEDPHELAAGKLAALCARRASRDCFDARELLRRRDLDREKLRLGFVIYGGINRVDWRAVTVDAIGVDTHEVRRELVPMLRAEARPSEDELAIWIEALVRETRELMSLVLPLAPHELEFLERLNGQGEIAPELLTDDVELQDRLRAHPGLLWKAHNVRSHVQNQGGTP